MCPMCEKRALLLLQQQAVVESSTPTVVPPGGTTARPDHQHTLRSTLFRNPLTACKHLTRQCCSPACESQRTSIASGRRSSTIAPVASTPEHSGHLTYIVSESPLSLEDLKEFSKPRKFRKRKPGLLTRLKALVRDEELQGSSSSVESSFTACGRKVMAVADELERDENGATGLVQVLPSVATLLVAETDLEDDSMSDDVSVAVTDSNVSETTILSMMNLNGSVSGNEVTTTSNRGSTLKSSAFDDDASSFAVIPRTSMNSSYVGRDCASDLSDRFGELDIGYLSLDESGEGPDFDDTVSISSYQSEHLDWEMHPQDVTVSESDYDHEYSISSTVDSQEWVTETEDAASILLRSRTHNNSKGEVNKPSAPRPPPVAVEAVAAEPPPSDDRGDQKLASRKASNKANAAKKEAPPKPAPKPPPPPPAAAAPETAETAEYLCSRCGRHEASNMSEQAVVAAKVVVLLGKYGNRKGMRVSALATNPQQHQQHLRSMIAQPSNDAISAFQNEVARMMLEGADVPELNMDVEQFIAGYMKLNSPFYIDLIQDFFKSVCIDCFGHIESGSRRPAPPQHPPAYAVLKARKTKALKGNQ